MRRMATEISKSKFKAQALEIFRRIETTGEPVVVTDHGLPKLIVRSFTPYDAGSSGNPLKGSVRRYDAPFEPVGEEDWEMRA